MATWTPQRTLEDVTRILCAPGSVHETEESMVDGKLQRVYKNIWPSLSVFWQWAANEYASMPYIAFEGERLTFAETHAEALKAAKVFKEVYGVRKGDRVALCSRNYPEYLVTFWACALIGAISVHANAWLPLKVLHHCFNHTGCKVIIVDAERAERIQPIAQDLLNKGVNGILVLKPTEGKGAWKNMKSWTSVMQRQRAVTLADIKPEPIGPEDNATIFFTSGTTGLPKGVLSTQRMALTNLLNCLAGSRRAALRRGEHVLPAPLPVPRKGVLISVPLFHVTGLSSMVFLATFAGMKIVFMRRWNPAEAVRLIKEENIGMAGGVPSMVTDLADTGRSDLPLETLTFGGAAAPELLASRTGKVYPTAALSQGYGLTETNSVAVSVVGEDYFTRPKCAGLPSPINDIRIVVNDQKVAVPGQVGEIWLRGPNIMKEYWRDPAATKKALTDDGWFKTGDLGYLDKEGFLYIKDRIKDIIIRGGENIDSISVENALYADERVLEAAAVGIPHKKLGEEVAVVVTLKPQYQGKVTEDELIEVAKQSLPRFAVPVLIVIRNEPLERTESGKIVKGELRKLAKTVWESKSKGEKPKL